MAMENHAMETDNGARLASSTKHTGGWLEDRVNELWKPWQSLGLGRDQMVNDSLNLV